MQAALLFRKVLEWMRDACFEAWKYDQICSVSSDLAEMREHTR